MKEHSDNVPPGSYHTPVLLNESLSLLLTAPQGIYVDATLGGGGHGRAILHRLAPRGRLIGFDLDADALKTASELLSEYRSQIVLIRENFAHLRQSLGEQGIREINGILFDLGVSSYQLDEPAKGFSFQSGARLDMRMDQQQRLDAFHVVNHYGERELADILWKYGEERHSRRIARAIIRHRSERPIMAAADLAQILRQLIGEKFLTKSLARVFQAIRIEVNHELENLKQGLTDAINLLTAGGRVVVISYHSLEDRIVKDVLKGAARTSIPSGNKILPDVPVQPSLKILTKKPIEAGKEEVRANPRSRSAKLRAAEKTSLVPQPISAIRE